jgi:hypothetical protein
VTASDDPVVALIEDAFERNLAELQADRGHALAPDVRATALNQVKLYWRRLREIAEKVTDTEVRLNLPGQKTPAGRAFNIEGVVDIVRERDRTVLYDIKTHEADEIRGNLDEYEKQLNVYAHIWQGLRGEKLDETAIICTRYPRAVDEALLGGDEAALQKAMAAWDPVIPIPFDAKRVDAIIGEFGSVVDRIEDHEFEPRDLATLKTREPGLRTVFAVAVCRNCDARFSCQSYRDYALGSAAAAEGRFRQYIEETADDLEQEASRVAALDASPADPNLDL